MDLWIPLQLPVLTLMPPSPITTMAVALRTVDSRCAMTMTVRPTMRRSIASCTRNSDSASSALSYSYSLLVVRRRGGLKASQ